MLSSVTRGHWRNTEGEMDFSSKFLLLSLDSCSSFSSTQLLSMTFPAPTGPDFCNADMAPPQPRATNFHWQPLRWLCSRVPPVWHHPVNGFLEHPRAKLSTSSVTPPWAQPAQYPPGWLCSEFWDTAPRCAWPPWLPWKPTSSKFHLLGGHLSWSFCLSSLQLLSLCSIKFSLFLTSQFFFLKSEIKWT